MPGRDWDPLKLGPDLWRNTPNGPRATLPRPGDIPMSTLETESTQPASAPAHLTNTNGPLHPARPNDVPLKRRRSAFRGFMIFLLVVGLAAMAGYTYKVGNAQVQEDANR